MSIDHLFAISPALETSTPRVEELRADILERAHQEPAQTARSARHRRPLLVSAAAAAVAAALVVGPSLLPGDGPGRPNPHAAVAAAAERSGLPTVGRGQVLHRVERIRQTGARGLQIDARQESWTLPDGTSYERRTDLRPQADPAAKVSVSYDDVVAGDQFTPAQVAGLPTDPDDLMQALAGSRQAENRGPDTVGVARELLIQIIVDGYAPADVWSAAIAALGATPGIEVRHDAARGETTVSHWMESKRGEESLVLRDSDGALLRLRAESRQDGGAVQTSRFAVDVVDEVPADVRRAASRQP